MPPAGDGWEPALAAALLGAERAPPAADPLSVSLAVSLAGADPGGALLARLAAHATLHRAGAGLGPEALIPAEPRARIGLECPAAAATRLHGLLADGPSAAARLAEWCTFAAARGMRAPDWLLPALAARRDTLPDAIDGIAAPELAWLGRARGDSGEGAEQPADWTDGTVAERRAAFTAWRARDPEAARLALEPVFRKEKADLREALVGALETGLSEADEPFLEACLDDRGGGVRMAAQRLLPHLPAARYAARMARRARAALAIESRGGFPEGTTHILVVTLPEASPDLARDGVTADAWQNWSGGARATLLRAILECAPPSAFCDHPPELWIGLALQNDWAKPILDGLHAMVRRTRDPAWALALADVLGRACAGDLKGVRPTSPLIAFWAQALALLPEAAWEARVGAVIRARRFEVLPDLLAHGPDRFSEGFSAALLDGLAVACRGSGDLRQSLAKGGVIGGLGERLWSGADAAASAAALVARLPEEGGGRLREHLMDLAETLALRAAMRRDFEPDTEREGARG